MDKRWITADQHYWHTNVIKYSERPFNTVEEMNSVLIKRHNECVKRNDKVFMLGDFGLANKEKLREIIQQLNGRLTLIMGNHDKGRSRDTWLSLGFTEVIRYPIIINSNLILSHEPILYDVEPYWNLHGHIHQNMMPSGRYFNMCVEQHDYRPVNLDDFIRKHSLSV